MSLKGIDVSLYTDCDTCGGDTSSPCPSETKTVEMEKSTVSVTYLNILAPINYY